MSPTGIVVMGSGLPRMLRDIVEGVLAEHPELEVRTEFARGISLEAAVRQTGARVVIAAVEPLEPAEVCHVLERWPRTKVLGVAGDARRAFLYELRPQKVQLGEMTPGALAAAIRDSLHDCAELLA